MKGLPSIFYPFFAEYKYILYSEMRYDYIVYPAMSSMFKKQVRLTLKN
jgi:hypothetical protein